MKNSKFRCIVSGRVTFLATFLFIGVVQMAQTAEAQDRWIDPTGGFWDVSSNWEDGSAPGPTEFATFDLDATYDVHWDSITGNTDVLWTNFDDGEVTFFSSGATFVHNSAGYIENAAILNLGRSPLESMGWDGNVDIEGGDLNVRFGSQFNADDLEVFSGSFNVQSGSIATGGRVRVGGTMNVTGVGSVFDAIGISTNGLELDSNGVGGTLNILDGGVVNVAYQFFSSRNRFGVLPATTLLVSGSGSQMNVESLFRALNGSVTIENGAIVNLNGAGGFGGGPVGGPNSNLTTIISGVGSELNVSRGGDSFPNELRIGQANSNSIMSVLDGALLTSAEGEIGSGHSVGDSSGTLVVSGAGSRWLNSENVEIGDANFGHSNAGELRIESGGYASTGLDAMVAIDDLSGPSALGTVQVNGAESRWEIGRDLHFGMGGIASLKITDSGRVDVLNNMYINDLSAVAVRNGQLHVTSTIDNDGTLALREDSVVFGDLLQDAGSSRLNVIDGITQLNGDLLNIDGQINVAEVAQLNILGTASGEGFYEGTGTVAFEGILAPGNSPAVIGFEGDVILGDASLLELELAGINFGEFDRLVINGDLDLSGDLSITLLDGFTLAVGMSFDFLEVGGILTGQFEGLNQNDVVSTFGNISLRINYFGGDGNDVELFATAVPTDPLAAKFLDGLINTGPLSNAFESDDVYLELDPNPTANPVKQKIDAIFLAVSTVATPTSFSFRVEAVMNGGPAGDVTQSIDLWNEESRAWETLDVRPATITDSVVEVSAIGDLTRFVHPVTSEILAKIKWESDSFSGPPFFWSIDLDQSVWLIE